MLQIDEDVRVHWHMADGRPACLIDGDAVEGLDDEEVSRVPFCGACLAVLMLMRLHGERLWEGLCAPPVDRPSAALAQISTTPWADLFNTERPDGDDLWWFETKEVDQ